MNNPLAEILLDKLILKEYEYEFELPCDGIPKREECHDAATWSAIASCGCSRLMCEDHKLALDIRIEENMGDLACGSCGSQHVRVTRIEPMKSY